MVVLHLTADRLGSGDDALGKSLLQTFLQKLVETEASVDYVLCLNSGVFLTTQEGPALESLKVLESRGVRIASCGTCLKHFDRKDKLLIGEVGTMDETVELLTTAEKIIRP